MVDYMVVGLGLAGLAFIQTLERNNKTFVVLNDTSQTASRVAGGLYNPVILKRFTMAWKGKEHLSQVVPFYQSLEKKLGVPLNYPLPVWRRFASIEEQNGWFEATDKADLSEFLSTTILTNKNKKIEAPFGFGEVLHTGKIDVQKLLITYEEYLSSKGVLHNETFDHAALEVKAASVFYKSFKARKVVFAEGFGMKRNPYFNYLPLTGTKGEYITIKAVGLKEERAIKAGVFSIPKGNDEYLVGATYKWKDTSNDPTEASRSELKEKLAAFVKCEYEVTGQVAGIRPTVTDRKPLVGQHPVHKNLFVLNGFGSRGVMIAPTASDALYRLAEHEHPIIAEMDIARFTKKHFQDATSKRSRRT